MTPASPARASLTAIAIALLALPAAAAAQAISPAPARDDFHGADDIIVTAPYVRSLDILGSVTVVQGERLAADQRGQIGDVLSRQAGVSATSFAPGASRPVLRGFQGERVRVLSDGVGTIDAANTSADHGVAVDPLIVERVEILRGPAVLLFGSQAIGGAVNLFDRRIPRAMPEAPFHLDAIAGFGSAADDKSAGVSIDVPLAGKLAFHVDASIRDSRDLRSGGFVLAPGLRAEVLEAAAEEADEGNAGEAAELTALAGLRGRIPNSAARTWTSGAGLSLITDGGTLGVSVSYYDSNYGVPTAPGAGHHHGEDDGDGESAITSAGSGGGEDEEAPVTIGMQQWRTDVRGEVELGGGLFDKLRLRAVFADYQHIEFEGDEVGTTFTNQGIEARLELTQADRGGWRGASGMQFAHRDFNAVGAEAFLPRNLTRQLALFTLQEWTTGRFSIEAAARLESASVRATTLGLARDFTSGSGALGVSYDFGDRSKFTVSVARTTRAPAAEELYSGGPHIATGAFEIGDPDLAQERSWGAEAGVRLRGGTISLNLTGYANWFSNFIYLDETGEEEDELPVFQYRQRDARIWGFEAEASARLFQAGGFNLTADGVADFTRAKLTSGAGDVPRIPPLRLRGGIEAASKALDLRAEVEWSDAQRRTAAFESTTAGFTLVNASLTWRPLANADNLALILSANNIFDVEARRHASFTKDFVPLAGRDIRATLRASF